MYNKITSSRLDDAIAKVNYFRVDDTNCIICNITLDNGFTVRGESTCVSRENFDKELGEKIAYDNARNKLWEFMGFLLHEEIYRNVKRL